MSDDASCREGRPARPEWDYAGAYLITLVSRRDALLFGRVTEGRVALSEAGRVVAEEWQRLAEQAPGVRGGEFVVMPNHLHGIVYLADSGRKKRRRGARRGRPSDMAVLGTAVARLKAAASRRISALGESGGGSIWRAGYRNLAVESRQELAAVRRLIRQDPARWAEDVENPARRSVTPITSRRAGA